jgi:hypothetical protein
MRLPECGDRGTSWDVVTPTTKQSTQMSQVLDKHSQIVDLIAVIRPPDGLQEFPMTQCLVSMLGQMSKKIQLFWRQICACFSVCHCASAEVDHSLTHAHLAALACTAINHSLTQAGSPALKSIYVQDASERRCQPAPASETRPASGFPEH